jgi:hypothetical protein
MKMAIFLAAVTIGLFFAIGIIAAQYGPKVSSRFLERGEAYSEADPKAFVTAFPRDARGYVFPVLFPCDLLFMIFLGGFLGLASMEAAQSIEPLKRVIWPFAVGPTFYVAADLVEDTLLARLLLSAETINQNSIALVQNITKAKFVTCTYAILQTIVLCGSALLIDR